MAEVLPFRGLVYNPEKIDDLSKVATPPYDVISERERKEFEACHPQNIIRLILGQTTDNDTETDNRYTRSAECCRLWCEDDYLVQDDAPAFYLTAIDFTVEDQKMRRYGLTARVRLEPFEKGIVLPHEKTFSKVKVDRFELMKTCHANFSPIFSLYSDGDHILDTLKESVGDRAPEMDFIDTAGHRQQLWRVTDEETIATTTKAMQSKTIFIADGHHRYETALTYRDWVAERTPDFTPDHPANFVMMYLSSMEDPGMVILPAHRLLKSISEEVLAATAPRFREYFDIARFPLDKTRVKESTAPFKEAMAAGTDHHTIGVCLKNRQELYVLTLKPNVMDELFENEMPPAKRHLDVSVLTRLIFMEILGFDQARLDNEALIRYTTSPREAVKRVLEGEFDAAFILNPTRIDQVQEVAKNQLVMPRKSTYFYPKVVTGQVMNPLE